MRAGYGRGYYGAGQLAQRVPRRKRSWFTVVAVLGVGAAAVWLLWPRSPMVPEFGGKGPEPPTPPTPTPPPLPASEITVPAAPSAPVGAFLKQLEDDALARGFSSTKEYEDSVVVTAKQLQAMGAKVVFAPHLEHLVPRLAP